MITLITQIFKTTLSKPQLKNTILTVIAIVMSKPFRFNEIARHLPVAVKDEKTKQKRLTRFVGKKLPIALIQERWLTFVFSTVYQGKRGDVLILIDETRLIGSYKAIVAAIPFRQRAIPIAFWVYTDDEIRSMKYKSHNTRVSQFCTIVYTQALSALPKRRRPILVFDRR